MVHSVFDNIYFEYGDLYLVKSPSLVERYKKALLKLTGMETSLSEFHIDCTGFSPEVAKELGNEDYLDAHGMNKKFILITMEQTEKDIVSTHFSSTMFTLKRFYLENYKALASLTARDAVIGELDNKQFKASRAIDVIKSNTIYINVDTANDLLKKTEQCMDKVDSVINGDKWDDDECLNEIIELSNDCGSLLKNEGLPRQFTYQRHHYYTALFGGMYVFDDDDGTVVIVEDTFFNAEEHGLDPSSIIFINEEKRVFKFLKKKGWINPIPFEDLKLRTEQLELKQLHSVLDTYIKRSDVKRFPYMDEQAVKKFIYDNYEELPSDFYILERLVNSLANNDTSLLENSDYRWQTHEVAPELSNKLYALLSHLMGAFSTYSYFRLFVYNRKRFEERYNKWSPAKQDYIKTYLFDGSEILNVLRSKQQVDLGV
tara:strand:- start:6370 stop:7656 length:1287 start_codon:yes stop_codon:yes gene_type:complete